MDPAIASHGGRIVKTTGDGLLLEFPSVVNAVRCAVEVQTAMADRIAGIAEDRRIAFRVGINIGDIIVEGDDIFGDGVNVAARLQEIAAPGGICISSRVHEDVRDRLDTAFDDGGTQTLKNISRPVQVWRWQPGTAEPPKPAPAPTALPLPDKPSIAVLPFQNMSGDQEQEYFADGVVEDIITALSNFKSLFVIARNSSFTYKSKVIDIKQVGRELGVRYVLEGSVRKSAGRVRITGQLIEASMAYICHQFDRGMWLADRAVALNPNLSTGWNSRGWISLMLGKAEQGIESFEMTLRLSPLDPARPYSLSGIAFGHFFLGRYDEGRRVAKEILQIFPHHQSFATFIVNCVGAGDLAEAKSAATQFLKYDPSFCVSRAFAIYPILSPELREKFENALRTAGIPE